MQQNINLYLFLPRTTKSFLTFLGMKYICFSFLLFLMIFYIFSLWGEHRQTQRIDNIHGQLNKIQNRIAAIQAQYPLINLNQGNSTAQKLQKELDESNKTAEFFSRNKEVSSYFIGFAKAVVPGVWLDNIQIALDQKKITLYGYAVNSKSVQQFMNHLTDPKELEGMHFQMSEWNKSEIKKESLLRFVIANAEGSWPI